VAEAALIKEPAVNVTDSQISTSPVGD